MKTIDLGKKSELLGATPEPAQENSKEPKVYYPSLYLNFDGVEKLDGLGETGEAIIKYKVVSKTISEREGEKYCSIDLEIHSITPKESSKKSSPMDDIEEGLKAEENYDEED